IGLCVLPLCLLTLVGFTPASAAPPERTALVTLRRTVDPASAEQLVRAAGGRVVETIEPVGIMRVAVAAEDMDAALGALGERSDVVKAAEIEGEQVAQVTPNDALYRAFQWNLRRIGMEQAWDLRPSAADVIVAVLDTGVDLTHPDLRPNLLLDL